jgi:chemotaxis protein MotA
LAIQVACEVTSVRCFSNLRKSGEIALEKDVDDPTNSEIFKRYPRFLGNHAAKSLMLDSLRLVVSGTASADELSHLMDEEIAIHEEEGRRPTGVLDKTAKALLRLGIVAAVPRRYYRYGRDGPRA